LHWYLNYVSKTYKKHNGIEFLRVSQNLGKGNEVFLFDFSGIIWCKSKFFYDFNKPGIIVQEIKIRFGGDKIEIMIRYILSFMDLS
jgi:hypothetical protein